MAGTWSSAAVSWPPASSSSHVDVRVLAQARREHAARRPGSDDHVVSHGRALLVSGTGRSLVSRRSVTKIVGGSCAPVRLSPMGAADRAHRALLDDVWSGRGALRPRSGACSTCATAASRRRASGSRASGSGTPTSSTCSRRARLREVRQLLDEHGLRYARARVPGGLVPRPERRAAARRRTSDARSCSRRPPSCRPTTSRSATSSAPSASCRGSSRRSASSAPTPPATRTRRSSTSSCRTTSNVNDVDTALAVVEGADAPNGGLALDTWHLGKLRLEPDELRRIPPRFLVLGRALRRAVRVRGGPARRGDQPPHGCPARASSRSRSTWPCAASSATTARGASRCSPRSSATSRSSRSSSVRTRRRARSSPLSRRERSLGV